MKTRNKERRRMKKILLLLTVLLFAMGARAQKDIVSMADAIKIFQAKTLQVGKQSAWEARLQL